MLQSICQYLQRWFILSSIRVSGILFNVLFFKKLTSSFLFPPNILTANLQRKCFCLLLFVTPDTRAWVEHGERRNHLHQRGEFLTGLFAESLTITAIVWKALNKRRKKLKARPKKPHSFFFLFGNWKESSEQKKSNIFQVDYIWLPLPPHTHSEEQTMHRPRPQLPLAQLRWRMLRTNV